MTYYLAGMAEAWELHDLCRHYPSNYDCLPERPLPEYPENVDHHELMKTEGFENAKSYMKGDLDNPQYPDDIDYMDGWNNGLDDFFTNQELFGENLDNSSIKS